MAMCTHECKKMAMCTHECKKIAKCTHDIFKTQLFGALFRRRTLSVEGEQHGGQGCMEAASWPQCGQ